MPLPRKLRIAVIVWLVTTTALALAMELAWEHLWIVAFVPLFLWAVAGLVLLGMTGYRLRYRDERPIAAVALVGLVAGAAVFLPLSELGISLTMKARFALQRGRYERVIAMLRDSTPERGYHDSLGLHYFVEPGPPLRLAFPWPGGVIDNWCGAVYDPTKVVLQANKFTGEWSKWHDQVPIEVIRLFGGDMLYCSELEPPFYHCCFT